mmetsp:Transcript_31403/g.66691  ORF Transcript_31403/g.66691 Transcript_31403/m.66691 type:complete len:282 (+) Transcript_31403:181-1026(+)
MPSTYHGVHTSGEYQRRNSGKVTGPPAYATSGPNGARRSPGIFAKTRPCQFFANNCCLRGDSCNFAHGVVDLRPTPDFRQTQFCIEYSRFGRCDNGESCTFAHSVEELRAVSRPNKGQMPTRPSIASASNAEASVRGTPNTSVSVEHKYSEGSSLMTVTDAESPVSSQPSTNSSYSGRAMFNFHTIDLESAENRITASMRVGKRRSANKRLGLPGGNSWKVSPTLSEEDEAPMTKHSKTEAAVRVSINKTFFHFSSDDDAMGSAPTRRTRSSPPKLVRSSS